LPLAAVLSLATAAGAAYWVEYEPASGLFPEQAGWTRVIHAGGAQRYFDEGALVLDGRASIQIVDYYRMDRPGALDPGVGEVFVAQWRLLVDEVNELEDPAVTVFSDDRWSVLFDFGEDHVRSFEEPGLVAWFEPYVYHDFELRSIDMRAYELFIDGHLSLAGSFHRLVSSSLIAWGDGVQGSASLSRWDYFRFGALPEPGALGLFVVPGTLFLSRGLRAGTSRRAPAAHKGSFKKET